MTNVVLLATAVIVLLSTAGWVIGWWRRRVLLRHSRAAAAAAFAAAFVVDLFSRDTRLPERQRAALAQYLHAGDVSRLGETGRIDQIEAADLFSPAPELQRAVTPVVQQVWSTPDRWWVRVAVDVLSYVRLDPAGSDRNGSTSSAAATTHAISAEDQVQLTDRHRIELEVAVDANDPFVISPGWTRTAHHPSGAVPVKAVPRWLRWGLPDPDRARSRAAEHVVERIPQLFPGHHATVVLCGGISYFDRDGPGEVVVDVRALTHDQLGQASWVRLAVPVRTSGTSTFVDPAGVVILVAEDSRELHPPAEPAAASPRPPHPVEPANRRRRGLLAATGVAALATAGVIAGIGWGPFSGAPTDEGATGAERESSAEAARNGAASPSGPGTGIGSGAEPGTTPVVAATTPTAEAPMPLGAQPGFVALSPSGSIGLITSPTRPVVDIFDPATRTVIGSIPLPVGVARYALFAPAGDRAYISVSAPDQAASPSKGGAAAGPVDSPDSREVVVVDVAARRVLERIAVGTAPGMGALSPDGSVLWVPSHGEGRIDVIDTARAEVISQIRVPPNPHWVTVSSDGSTLLVASHESNVVSVLDAASMKVQRIIPVGRSPHSTAIAPDGTVGVAANYDGGTVSVIDMAGGVKGTVPVPDGPQAVTFSRDGRLIYVVCSTADRIAVIDVATMKVTSEVATPGAPTSISLDPSGATGWVSDYRGQALTLLQLGPT